VIYFALLYDRHSACLVKSGQSSIYPSKLNSFSEGSLEKKVELSDQTSHLKV